MKITITSHLSEHKLGDNIPLSLEVMYLLQKVPKQKSKILLENWVKKHKKDLHFFKFNFKGHKVFISQKLNGKQIIQITYGKIRTAKPKKENRVEKN